jgi:hypothetical protein
MLLEAFAAWLATAVSLIAFLVIWTILRYVRK